MKKFKIVLTAIVMLFASSSFALDPVKVSPVVKSAFAADFTKAKNVSWEKTSDFYFASFVLNNTRVDAAYSPKGELLGTSRRISVREMPLSISLAIAEMYEGYQVNKSVAELTFDGVTWYYVNVEDDNKLLKLKCYANGDLEVDSKLKKVKS